MKVDGLPSDHRKGSILRCIGPTKPGAGAIAGGYSELERPSREEGVLFDRPDTREVATPGHAGLLRHCPGASHARTSMLDTTAALAPAQGGVPSRI